MHVMQNIYEEEDDNREMYILVKAAMLVEVSTVRIV